MGFQTPLYELSEYLGWTTGGKIQLPDFQRAIEAKAQIPPAQLDGLLDSHLILPAALRDDDFDRFFVDRRERLCDLIEQAMGKSVQRDVDEGLATEGSEQFEPEAEDPDPLTEEEHADGPIVQAWS